MRRAFFLSAGASIVVCLAAFGQDQSGQQPKSDAQSSSTSKASDLPDGAGKDTLLRVCSNCHDLSAVMALRLPRSGWQQVEEDMVGRGAVASDDELAQILSYLTENFGPLNVNTATRAQLQSLLQLTEKDARAVIDYRQKNGRIKDFDDLRNVPGIDVKQLEKKRSIIVFADPPSA
jgi:competence protein ComEA